MKNAIALLTLLAIGGCNRDVERSVPQPGALAVEKAPRWTKVEIPLDVDDLEIPSRHFGYVSLQGFWQSTSSNKDRQLAFPVAVKIQCDREDKICKESQATVILGVLGVNAIEYVISSWTKDGIVADDSDEGDCGIGHRLSIHFKTKSVTVTDYPKKVTSNKNCQSFQDADSYALHGGEIMLYPPAPWEPLAKPFGEK